mgnify:CR=1 FL=1
MASEKSSEVFRLLVRKGFPEEFCRDIAYKYMNTDYTAERMAGYLRRMPDRISPEEVVDEMLAILSDRNRFVEKHRTEQAQAHISEFYNSPERGE